jgi:hypothetical protein
MAKRTWLADTLALATVTLAGNSTFRTVDDPAGTPESGKCSLDDFIAYAALNGDLIANFTDNWDNAGTTWYGIKLNVVDDASGANSRLLQIERNGTANLYIDKYGTAFFLRGDTAGDGTAVRNLMVDLNSNTWRFSAAGSTVLGLDGGSAGASGDVKLRGDVGTFGFTSSSSVTTAADTAVARDAADTWAHRRANNGQTVNRYGEYTSSTNYQRLSSSVAKATLSAVSGASVVATGLIPAGAQLIGLTSRIGTGLGTSNGTTGYQIGDGSDADRWGAITGTASGTTTDDRNWTDFTQFRQAAAKDVTVTAVGGNFDGTGSIVLCAFYQRGEAD